jgi:hypothetical protein
MPAATHTSSLTPFFPNTRQACSVARMSHIRCQALPAAHCYSRACQCMPRVPAAHRRCGSMQQQRSTLLARQPLSTTQVQLQLSAQGQSTESCPGALLVSRMQLSARKQSTEPRPGASCLCPTCSCQRLKPAGHRFVPMRADCVVPECSCHWPLQQAITGLSAWPNASCRDVLLRPPMLPSYFGYVSVQKRCNSGGLAS